MNKIKLIIGREVRSKLSNKTFIIMTFLTPFILVGAIALIVWTALPEKIEQRVLVIDEVGIFKQSLRGNDFIELTFSDKKIEEAQNDFQKSSYTSILYLFKGGEGTIIPKARIFYKKNPGLAFETYLRNELERIYYEYKLQANNIDPSVIASARQKVEVEMSKVDETGAVKSFEGVQFLSFAMGLVMMMFIIMYGMMVFRSVMEEKTNRIVEVIVSSVRPFDLMIGKIIGVAIVGLIQFICTALVTFLLVTILSGFFLKDVQQMQAKFKAQDEMVKKHGTNVDLSKMDNFKEYQETFRALEKLKKIDFVAIAIYFVLFFIGGYLFYSSLLAAIGSAVDSEADSQQFMFPIMIPLMIGYFLAVKIMISPESDSVVIGSYVPFTSPIVMLARMPQGVPYYQVNIALAILYVSFIFTTWIAGRIYRTGILMYGKKPSWREIGKWLFYK